MQMNITTIVICAITLTFSMACDQNNSTKENTTSVPAQTSNIVSFVSKSLNGELYIMAPSIDSTTCLAYGECDCCASHYAFLDDTTFIAVDYCLEGDTYYKGNYEMGNNNIILHFGNLVIQKEYNMDEVGSEGSFKLRLEKYDSQKIVYPLFLCKGNTCFKNPGDETHYATKDTMTLKKFIETLKADGISKHFSLK
jgi:hypothetical protein